MKNYKTINDNLTYINNCLFIDDNCFVAYKRLRKSDFLLTLFYE